MLLYLCQQSELRNTLPPFITIVAPEIVLRFERRTGDGNVSQQHGLVRPAPKSVGGGSPEQNVVAFVQLDLWQVTAKSYSETTLIAEIHTVPFEDKTPIDRRVCFAKSPDLMLAPVTLRDHHQAAGGVRGLTLVILDLTGTET